MFNKPKRRQDNAINAGSMADIAFLLLIFFLVTTTILVDKGIAVCLPAWTEEPPTTEIANRNILLVKLNARNELFVENSITEVQALRQLTRDFIMNPTGLDSRPKAPNRAVISLHHDRGASYEAYLGVYNELMAAYNELWDEAAHKQFGRPYGQLSSARQAQVRAAIPLVISEAEPVDLMAGE